MMGDVPPPPAPMPASAPRERPFGVTLLGILYFLEGLMFLLLPFIGAMLLGSMLGDIGGLGDVEFELTAAFLICFIPFIIIALIYFIIALGLLKGKGWARIIAIIFAIIGLLNVPIGTIISIIILIYLFKPEVKAYFGK